MKSRSVFSYLCILCVFASFQADWDDFTLAGDFKQELASAALHLRQQPS